MDTELNEETILALKQMQEENEKLKQINAVSLQQIEDLNKKIQDSEAFIEQVKESFQKEKELFISQTQKQAQKQVTELEQNILEDYKRKKTINEEEFAHKMHNMLIKVFIDFIDIFDNLEMISEKMSQVTNDKDIFLPIINSIIKRMKNIMEKNNIKILITNIGEDFNPELHMPLYAEKSELPTGKINKVIKHGFLLNDKVLRHAIVIVSE